MSSTQGGYMGGPIIAATVFGLALPIAAVSLRLISRRYHGGGVPLYLEDYLIFAALVFKIGLDIGGGILLANGLGRHIVNVSASELVTFAKTQYTGSILYPLCIACVKLSILSQYKRMFSDGSRSFRIQIQVLTAVVIAWCVAILLVASMQCIPLRKLWDPTVEGTCVDVAAFYYGMQIPNVITDLLLVVCPIRMVLDLDLPLKLQVAAITMFLLGVTTLVFDIIRLTVLINLSATISKDLTYDVVDAAVWTTIEPAIAIVTVCIPSIRSLHRKAAASRRRTRDLQHEGKDDQAQLHSGLTESQFSQELAEKGYAQQTSRVEPLTALPDAVEMDDRRKTWT